MKYFQVLLICFLSCIYSIAIYASNYSFMETSAIARFNDKDAAMMSANIENALNHTPDGKKSSWKNPNTGSWGYAMPSKTIKSNGAICRNLNIFNEAQKVQGESNYIFCKIKGVWKINIR